MIHAEGLRHPYLSTLASTYATTPVPNNLSLGKKDGNSKAMVLTGPNMGGKSTLMRATCICVIMAQIGCYVPAEKCVISPCDRIFARMGASDNLTAGMSSFH
jgi:DNA mismatch repair protein MSH6